MNPNLVPKYASSPAGGMSFRVPPRLEGGGELMRKHLPFSFWFTSQTPPSGKWHFSLAFTWVLLPIPSEEPGTPAKKVFRYMTFSCSTCDPGPFWEKPLSMERRLEGTGQKEPSLPCSSSSCMVFSFFVFCLRYFMILFFMLTLCMGF